MFAVVEFNQASGRPGSSASVWDSFFDAEAERATLTAEARLSGRRERYRVYELTEVDDEERSHV